VYVWAHVAVAPFIPTLVHSGIGVLPLRNVIVPPVGAGVTVAVYVTAAPVEIEAADDVVTVVVAAWETPWESTAD
jgi:hypothetical protein